jgi:hypothetical protein
LASLRDRVKVGPEQYARVFSLGHYDRSFSGEFIQIHATGLTAPLEMTKDHMIFVQDNHSVSSSIPASILKVGDKLLLNSGDITEVTELSMVKSYGAYAPFTTSETIAVNGVIASSYISLLNFTVPGVSMHWIAHAFLAPRRLLCELCQRGLL